MSVPYSGQFEVMPPCPLQYGSVKHSQFVPESQLHRKNPSGSALIRLEGPTEEFRSVRLLGFTILFLARLWSRPISLLSLELPNYIVLSFDDGIRGTLVAIECLNLLTWALPLFFFLLPNSEPGARLSCPFVRKRVASCNSYQLKDMVGVEEHVENEKSSLKLPVGFTPKESGSSYEIIGMDSRAKKWAQYGGFLARGWPEERKIY
ncbi:hypothetical protein FNV43_RR26524 [Rhamnella rubrinervis]|uniref:Uncharacterized protein n=1 Tax=Rhamnella rubrinervis TaxID=2594499 RepID=A0A8K0GPB2_9ROSA|nr:hypothetical protein FNV43_RR26524 [Rhamnella rubrinervis]